MMLKLCPLQKTLLRSASRSTAFEERRLLLLLFSPLSPISLSPVSGGSQGGNWILDELELKRRKKEGEEEDAKEEDE